MKIPTLIHEQNAVMGRANKALASRVNAIAGGFLPSSGGPFADKTIVTGNPVRPAVLAEVGKPYRPSQPHQPFHFLVFGGSQGAQYFSSAIPAAIKLLAPEDQARLVLTQQARAEDEAQVRSAYQSLGIKAEVAPFFKDMPRRIADAHFIRFAIRCVHCFRDSRNRPARHPRAVSACARPRPGSECRGIASGRRRRCYQTVRALARTHSNDLDECDE